MELNRTRLCLIWTVAVLFHMVFVPLAGAGASAPGTMSPAERHRIMAAGKAGIMERRTGIAVMPAAVVDVSGYDATYYRIELSIDEVAQFIYGQVSMRALARVDGYTTPTLHLRDEMEVDSVTSFGEPVAWTHVSSLLYVTLNAPFDTGEEFEITIWYHGYPPQSGEYFSLFFDTHAGVPAMATLSQPFMAQAWWPCKDTPSDKADSVDMIATVRSDLYAVSNGVLRDSVDNGDGTTTYSWHEGYPIVTYLVSLAITNYARFDLWYHCGPGDLDSMPVRFYAYPELLDSALLYWPVTMDQLEFFSELFGEYPFTAEKYGMAQTEWGGAMEHQTVTSITSGVGGDTRAFDPYTIAHELAHQWWGDMITCRNWHHIWLNESFASYCEALWEEHVAGAAAYRDYVDGMNRWTMATLYCYDTVNALFSGVYSKGPCVLHMLRGVVGDSAFFAILREYANHPDHRYKDAVTEEFRDIAEAVSGLDLDEFFLDWIYGKGYPKYACSWMGEPRSEDNFYNVYIHIRQFQDSIPLVFDMPIQLKFLGLGGDPVYRVWNTKREQDFVVVVPKIPTSIVCDPDGWILNEFKQEPYGLNLVTESLASGTQYMPYTDSLLAKGGTPPYEYTVAVGSLPDGLTLDPETGKIAGVPRQSVASAITFGVRDAGGALYREKTLAFEVAGLAYMPGDQNGDLFLDALDLSSLIDYLFAGAPPPPQINATDLNGDCQADALDLAVLIDHLFVGGPLPSPGCIE